jgi:hypothetical protein
VHAVQPCWKQRGSSVPAHSASLFFTVLFSCIIASLEYPHTNTHSESAQMHAAGAIVAAHAYITSLAACLSCCCTHAVQ